MRPSKRRRQGYEAFFNGGDAQRECPCRNNTWERDNWIEGWNKAQAEQVAEQEAQVEQDSDWIRSQIRDANNLDELKEALLEMYDINFIVSR